MIRNMRMTPNLAVSQTVRDRGGHNAKPVDRPPVSGKMTSMRASSQFISPDDTKVKKEREMSRAKEQQLILKELEEELFNENTSESSTKKRRVDDDSEDDS